MNLAEASPLHIALVIPRLTDGGAERSTVALARGLIARGHKVDLCLFDRSIASGIEIPPDIRLFVLDTARVGHFRDRLYLAHCLGWGLLAFLTGKSLQRTRALAAYVDRERPDCILPHLSGAKIASLLASYFTSAKPALIPVMHNVVMNRSRISRYRYSLLFPIANRIIAVSDGVAETLANRLKLPWDHIERIYNPVVRPEIQFLAQEMPNHPWMSDQGPPVVLAAGRFTRAKDFPTLVRAFHIVSSRRAARLIVLGDGPYRRKLERLVRNLRLQDVVAFPGWVPNPFAYMSRASAFAMSSKFEGLGNVLIEALACGCPCVSTNCPSGPSEILDEGRFGSLVPVADHAAMADAIEHVLDHPPDSNTLRARAEMFSFDRAIERYERVIIDAACSASSAHRSRQCHRT